MSVIFLQIGQCGNQIGKNIFNIFLGCKVFNNLLNEMLNSTESLAQSIADTYFTMSQESKLYANSLLIDMEAKVIEKCLKGNYINL
jgi:hypothetical protein